MVNAFSEGEDRIFYNESIIFDEEKIKKSVLKDLTDKLNVKPTNERAFFFEEVMYDFFEYIGIDLIKTKKTRDFGIDGVIKIKLDLFGDVDLGLQIKYKLIDSTDIDLFLTATKNAELQLGVIVCKDSRQLQKYELNSKIKAILLSKGIKVKDKIIKENININPVFILKMGDITEIVTSKIRGTIKTIYKK